MRVGDDGLLRSYFHLPHPTLNTTCDIRLQGAVRHVRHHYLSAHRMIFDKASCIPMRVIGFSELLTEIHNTGVPTLKMITAGNDFS
jgi:hypothetical protein